MERLNNWIITKSDRKGTFTAINPITKEMFQRFNKGSFSNQIIIHKDANGLYNYKVTDMLDAGMYWACLWEEKPYSENWQEETKLEYGHMSFAELVLAFAKESTPDQIASMFEALKSVAR